MNSVKEIAEYIESQLASRQAESYDGACDVVADTTYAIYNFMLSRLGMTGWQASHADLKFIKKARGFQGPFAIIDSQDLLYPQNSIKEDVDKYIDEWSMWASEAARRLIEADDARATGLKANSAVRAHWEKLARGENV